MEHNNMSKRPIQHTSHEKCVLVNVELFGTSRILVGTQSAKLCLPTKCDLTAVVESLAQSFPDLCGQVIDQNKTKLMESYTLNQNGGVFLDEGNLTFNPGDTLLLFSSQAGG